MSNYGILNAYIFKKNTEIIGKYPDNLDISEQESLSHTPYHNIVPIINNKGDDGVTGIINYRYNDIKYDSNCYNCEPTDIPVKESINSINNGEKELTISPNIFINNVLFTSNIEITSDVYNNIIINKDNIKNLKDLLNSQHKCNSGYELNGFNETSIGYCQECDVSDIPFSSYKQNSCVQECNENYTENPSDNGYKCLILCGEGHKRYDDDNECHYCGVNYYKENTNTSTECSLCPVGSTTNSNETAKAITDCTARPGYEYSENTYKPKPGNIDNEPDGPDGIIDGCENTYYYNGIECETCGPLSGIECTGGPIQYNEKNQVTNYPKRKLLSGYRLNDNTPYPCEGDKYRNGDIVIEYNVTSEDCTECPGGSIGNGKNNVNTECTLLPGYEWKIQKNFPSNYEVTLKPGNNDQQPYDGEIDRCNENYYYHNNECIECSQSAGIKCDGGEWSEAKKYLIPGYGTIVERFYNNSIKECDGEREYRHGEVEYNDNTQIPCNLCPIGSESDDNNDACVLNKGYRWEDNSSSPPNYQTTLMSGYLDNETDGIVDECSDGYYNDGTNCVLCNYGEGIDCTGGPINASKRILQDGYSWDGNNAQYCSNNQYRLGKREVEDDIINCTDCPFGTSYNNDNGCKLNTGYSWGVDASGNSNNITDNLYNEPLSNDAYYYVNDKAIGCTGGYYNIGNNVCSQCSSYEGIDCSTNRPFDEANMTLKPNYSWNGTTATKCPKGEKREGNKLIYSSDITCNPCRNKIDNSDYVADEGGKQLYNDSDDSCKWSCNEGYELNYDKCLKQCQPGEKRIDNTCEPCEEDHYKETVRGETHTDTSCTQCPIGSTTNGIRGSESIGRCTARPGYEDNDRDNVYTLKQGNIDNESDGIIDGCEYNYGFNSNTKECYRCPSISNGDYDPSVTTDNCTNIICNPGYKLDNGSCQPCGIDYYKDGINIDESCTQCPIGSTTGDNETAIGITDCTARPGYSKESENNYKVIEGNIDNDKDGIIDGCENAYYNGTECETCGHFGYGIECTGGPIQYNKKNQVTNYPKRKLLSGYGLDNNTPYHCEGDKYRNGDIDIDYNETSESCNSCRRGSTGSTGNIGDGPNTQCSLLPGYEWIDNYSSPPNYQTKLKKGNLDNNRDGRIDKCRTGYYYDGTECIQCNFGNGVECRGGLINDEKNEPKRYLLPGYEWNNNTKESTRCPDRRYRIDKEEILDDTIECSFTCDGNQNVNEERTGCVSDDGYEYYGNRTENEFYCSRYYYYDNNDNKCVLCGSNPYTYCHGGSKGEEVIKGEKMLRAGYGTDSSGGGIKCTDGTYRKGDVEFRNGINCYECNYTKCPDNEILVGCDGASSGECSECPLGEIPNTDKTGCETACEGNNTYYDVTACPENTFNQGGNCVCEEGYELNESGDGCKIIRKLSRNDRCNHNNECYSGSCITFCQPVLLGGTCRDNSDCSTNSRCYNGKCTEILSYGDNCETNTNSDVDCLKCPSGYYYNRRNKRYQCQPEKLSQNRLCDHRSWRYDFYKIYPDCSKCINESEWNPWTNTYKCRLNN